MAVTVLPALSRQVAATVAAVVAAPAYVVEVHDAMPEKEEAVDRAGDRVVVPAVRVGSAVGGDGGGG